ncbi:hypothetical protein WR25_15430 [Diploscapter pachys]|uniref:Uncharacterized protein n=1 Tax=Diploscapter pachys TaxID=2018661 RepID=A0A2A2LNE0_9BILA|nr:hypothetical protein WR25_15430 [Diploscapter pachys]
MSQHFYFPLRREIFMLTGGVDSSAESLEYLLANPGKNRAVVIAVGGTTEILDSQPDCYDLNILSRRGFCKYALKHGADLVPMYNFGENALFEQFPNPKGSLVRIFQLKIKSIFGFVIPMFKCRHAFDLSLGIMPHRRPVTSVVGEPIRLVVI